MNASLSARDAAPLAGGGVAAPDSPTDRTAALSPDPGDRFPVDAATVRIPTACGRCGASVRWDKEYRVFVHVNPWDAYLSETHTAEV